MAAIKRIWREELHPRDNWGRFTHRDGGGTPSAPTPQQATPTPADVSRMADSAIRRAAGRGGITRRPERGMPNTIARLSVPLKSGGTIDIERHGDGTTTLNHNGRRINLTDQHINDLPRALVITDDWDSGDSEDYPGFGRLTKITSGYRIDFENGGSAHLTRRELTKLSQAIERAPSAQRVETGYGPLDVFANDPNKATIRHLGDDGRPVEVTFTAPAFGRILAAYGELLDDIDIDLDEGTRRPTYSKTVNTNVGRVRVEITGTGNGSGPDDTILIVPTKGYDWGMAISGPNSRAWYDAMAGVREYLNW